MEERVTDNLLEERAPPIKRDTLLLIDPSDIRKKYAKKMEYLAHHALEAAKRIFAVPDFRYYALADGIKAFLFGFEAPFRKGKAQPRADPQLMLPL